MTRPAVLRKCCAIIAASFEACTNTCFLIGRRLNTRTATAWTIGARIFVELEEPTDSSIDLSDYANREFDGPDLAVGWFH